MLSKNLTLGARFLLCLVFINSSAFAAKATLRCGDLFLPAVEAVPPTRAGWESFLDSISAEKPEVPMGFVAADISDQSLIEDYRLTQVHEIAAKDAHKFNAVHFQADMNSLKTDFEYLYTISPPNAQTMDEGFHVFKSVKSGRIFSVMASKVPFRFEFNDDLSYLRALLAYLQSQEIFAQSKVTSPKLDYYFDRMKFSPKDRRDFDRNHYWSHEPERKGQIEEHFIFSNHGDSSSNFSRFAFKQTIEKENFFIEIIDTYASDVWAPTTDPAIGRSKQREWIKEIMSVVLPDYVERRGWSLDFIKHLYASILTTADNTRYISIRKKMADGSPGEILATLGLNRSSYGTTRYFDTATGRWETQTGPYGMSYAEDYGHQSSSYDHRFHSNLWAEKIPLLGMENYLNIRLPRPYVIDNVFNGFFNYHFGPDKKTNNPNIHPDSSKPIYFGSGEIYEPVRFWVKQKSELRGAAYADLISAILKSIFPEHRGVAYGALAQYLYTYNPREGVILYRGQGFKPMAQFSPQTKDGTNWHLLESSPSDFALKAHSSTPAPTDDEAQQFIRRLRETVDQLLAPKPAPPE